MSGNRTVAIGSRAESSRMPCGSTTRLRRAFPPGLRRWGARTLTIDPCRFRRDRLAAVRFFRRLLRVTGRRHPPVVVTDKPRSYAAAKRVVMPRVADRQHRYLNNRAEKFASAHTGQFATHRYPAAGVAGRFSRHEVQGE